MTHSATLLLELKRNLEQWGVLVGVVVFHKPSNLQASCGGL